MAAVLSCFSGPEMLEDANHARGLMKQMKLLYDCHLLGDVTIEVFESEEGLRDPSGDTASADTRRVFLCSRIVLASASPYFKSMFTGGLNESVSERVVIRGVDAESMSIIIDYCYTGTVMITESNVQKLYAAANMLQLEYIVEACSSFMTRRLDLANCVMILKFADIFYNPVLKQNAQAFIARNFSQLCNRELCELDLKQLVELLSLDSLDVDCEKKVCSAALQWIEANAPRKKEDAVQVFKCVRWDLFKEKDESYLESLMARPLIDKYLASVFNASPKSSPGLPTPLPKHRIGVSAKEVLLFFGLPDDTIKCFDPESEDLYFMSPPLPNLSSQDYFKPSTVKSVIACASPDNNLYLASHLSRHFWLYNPVKNTWQELAQRPLKRSHSGMCYLNGHVYILGGMNAEGDARIQEVECYSVQRNQWTFVAPLPYSLGNVKVVALNDHLYVVNKRRLLCYDPERNHWHQCGSLQRDKLLKACVFQDQIICVCDIPIVKAYSPSRGEWRRLADIPIVSLTLYYQMIQHNSKLLLLIHNLVHYDRKRVLIIHEYDPAQDSWKYIMAVHVSNLGSVCVSMRVYPACLNSAPTFSKEENNNPDWDFDRFPDADTDSDSSSSFSDD